MLVSFFCLATIQTKAGGEIKKSCWRIFFIHLSVCPFIVSLIVLLFSFSHTTQFFVSNQSFVIYEILALATGYNYIHDRDKQTQLKNWQYSQLEDFIHCRNCVCDIIYAINSRQIHRSSYSSGHIKEGEEALERR